MTQEEMIAKYARTTARILATRFHAAVEAERNALRTREQLELKLKTALDEYKRAQRAARAARRRVA